MMSTTTKTTQAPSATCLEDVLKKDGRLVYRGAGVSMKPLIREGIDLVDIRANLEVKLYDIVLYRRRIMTREGEETKYVLHRVLADEGDHYLILGDNCLGTEHVAKEDILGTVETILRKGKPINERGPAHRLYLRMWIRPWKMRTTLLRAKLQMKRGIASVLPKIVRQNLKSSKNRFFF